ncbi:MAG: hypothetical protein AAGG07_10250 [Planctomycetota bacterium]
MHRIAMLAAATAATALAGSASAAGVSLASTMNDSGFISENAATFTYAQINEGDGTLGGVGFSGDADGLYLLSDFNTPNPSVVGTPIDLFPREADFQIGGISFDASSITGTGIETVGIDSVDLSELWANDPNRTAGAPGVPPSVLSDISDRALGLWFFDADGELTFAAPDASDTLTFTDGVLTSIDLDLDATFSVATTIWNGSFSISGDQLSYQISDTQFFGFGDSTLTVDLTGTVNAVGSFAIPSPGTASLVFAGGLLAGRRRR